MTDDPHTDPDADAALMLRVSQIIDEECMYVHCADTRLCDVVGRLAVRIARMEREKERADT